MRKEEFPVNKDGSTNKSSIPEEPNSFDVLSDYLETTTKGMEKARGEEAGGASVPPLTPLADDFFELTKGNSVFQRMEAETGIERLKTPELRTFDVEINVDGESVCFIKLPIGISEDDIKKAVLENETIKKMMTGKTVKQTIYRKGKSVDKFFLNSA